MQLSRRLVRVICSSVVVLRLLSWSCSSGLAYVTGSSVMMPADCSVWVEETKDCDYDVTSELVAASSSSSSDTPSNSDGEDPYRREVQLQVERLAVDGGSIYRLFNTSRAAAPFLSFEVPRSASVLRAVYDATTVKDDATLTAELRRRASDKGGSSSSSWVLTVAGQLQRCPGVYFLEREKIYICVRLLVRPLQALLQCVGIVRCYWVLPAVTGGYQALPSVNYSIPLNNNIIFMKVTLNEESAAIRDVKTFLIFLLSCFKRFSR